MSRPQRDKEGEASATQQSLMSTRGSKGPSSEKVALLVLSALLAATVFVICRLSLALVQTNERFQKLRDDLDVAKRNFTAEKKCEGKPCIPLPKPTCPERPCQKCEEGWEMFGKKCYYFSTNKSTWSKSRADCQQRGSGGGDLVKIDSREEQSFFDQELRDKMTENEDKFWIGLTDSVTEGTLLWVDGSPLNSSLVFWREGEPDDWKGENPEGEDCVRIGERRGAVDLKNWHTRSCEVPHKYICEKPTETGQMKCV